ncbi:hypothetical protein [Halomonas sp. H5]|uniref:hypothetical protein n=1 Tax=Halomonas sp. H5 TaxID=3423910 RepID=UPI003D3650EE
MMVSAYGLAQAYTDDQPVRMPTDQFTWINFGANAQAARVSGVKVRRPLILNTVPAPRRHAP